MIFCQKTAIYFTSKNAVKPKNICFPVDLCGNNHVKLPLYRHGMVLAFGFTRAAVSLDRRLSEIQVLTEKV